jgi:starch-binding outer membrane protein, SusD/RagB family
MKYFKINIIIACLVLSSCKKTIDLYPISNLNSGTFYSNTEEVRAGLVGAYNGLQKPLYREWQLTELRSDNSRQGVPASTNSFNRDLSDLDMFIPSTSHDGLYQYWLDSYNNIRNANIILQKLGVNYDPASGNISLSSITIPIADADRKQFAGEALFIRAYHYFNLVRLYGGVFLVHKPVSAVEAKTINRSTVADIYKLIQADLLNASTYMNSLKFAQIANADRGIANSWAAKALLAKVYLTLNKKTEAKTLLQDVILNSGFATSSVTYPNIFSISNEMNSEILFTVRYKAGGFGLGSSFGNDFGPLNSGALVINGSGRGWNTPTTDIDSFYTSADTRKAVNIAKFQPGTSGERIYVKKFLNPVVITDDGEADWPVMRFADVLLMFAEADGNTTAAVGYINQVRQRSGLSAIASPQPSIAAFEKELAEERRREFAFENHRWFDLLRYGTTMTTINALQVMKAHFAYEYAAHYSNYLLPTPTLAFLQASVTTNSLILPIPQREIDTNTQLVIAQNPGY